MATTVREAMVSGKPQKYSVRVNHNGKYSHKFKLPKSGLGAKPKRAG